MHQRDPNQQQAKAEIANEIERLRWRTWNGKAKNARITLKRLRALLPALKGEPVRKLKQALRAVDRYLRSQSAWLVNYAERWRAGLRVGTSLTEGTANFLVNRRMAKSQQMRWSRRGADCSCKSAVRSTMAHLDPASASCSSRHPVQGCTGGRQRSPPTAGQSPTTRLVLSLPPHPSNLWTAPTARCKRLGQQLIHGIPWG